MKSLIVKSYDLMMSYQCLTKHIIFLCSTITEINNLSAFPPCTFPTNKLDEDVVPKRTCV